MQYSGSSRNVRVRIMHGAAKCWAKYGGQECDATLYDPPVNPQINSEQLNPPMPKWQTIPLEDIEVIRDL